MAVGADDDEPRIAVRRQVQQHVAGVKFGRGLVLQRDLHVVAGEKLRRFLAADHRIAADGDQRHLAGQLQHRQRVMQRARRLAAAIPADQRLAAGNRLRADIRDHQDRRGGVHHQIARQHRHIVGHIIVHWLADDDQVGAARRLGNRHRQRRGIDPPVAAGGPVGQLHLVREGVAQLAQPLFLGAVQLLQNRVGDRPHRIDRHGDRAFHANANQMGIQPGGEIEGSTNDARGLVGFGDGDDNGLDGHDRVPSLRMAP